MKIIFLIINFASFSFVSAQENKRSNLNIIPAQSIFHFSIPQTNNYDPAALELVPQLSISYVSSDYRVITNAIQQNNIPWVTTGRRHYFFSFECPDCFPYSYLQKQILPRTPEQQKELQDYLIKRSKTN